MKLSCYSYIAATLSVTAAAFGKTQSSSAYSALIQQERLLLRPAVRPKGAPVVARRSRGRKFAGRRSIAAIAILGSTATGHLALPVRIRSASALDEDDDIDDNFDCEDEQAGNGSDPVDNPKEGSTGSVTASASAATVTVAPAFDYKVTQTSSVASSGSSSPRPPCTRYHTVSTGEICLGIANYPENTGLTFSKLLSYNPAVNSDCTNLFVGEVLCTAM